MNPHSEKETNHSPLDDLFWRDEILEVFYWLKGENISQVISSHDLLPLLNTDQAVLEAQLKKLVAAGYLLTGKSAEQDTVVYSLSDFGKKEAGLRFAQAFEGMQKVGHGECGPECDCNWEGSHATCHHHHHD